MPPKKGKRDGAGGPVAQVGDAVARLAEEKIQIQRAEKEMQHVFEENFLHTGESSDYLDECSNKIDITGLYELHDTCYFSQNGIAVPVVFKVKDPELVKAYDGKEYLMQVWCGGRKIFERALHKPPQAWGVNFQAFIYLVNQEGEDEGKEFLVAMFWPDTAKPPRTVHVPNFLADDKSYDSIVCGNDRIWATNGKNIRVFQYQDNGWPKTSEVVECKKDPADYNIIEVGHGFRIQAFFTQPYSSETWNKEKKIRWYAILSEDKDSRCHYMALDVNNTNKAETPEFGYKWSIKRDSMESKVRNDPIKKFLIVNTKSSVGLLCCYIVLRESGNVDIYNAGRRTYQSDESDDYAGQIEDVIITFESTFFQMKDGTMLQMSNNQRHGISLENTKDVTGLIDIRRPKSQIIKNSVRLASSYCFRFQEMVFSHNRFVTICNLKKDQKHHYDFKSDVLTLIRTTEPYVVLKNGEIHKDLGGLLRGGAPPKKVAEIPGKIYSYFIDREDSLWVYFMTKQTGESKVFSIQAFNTTDCKCYALTGTGSIEFSKTTRIIPIYSPAEATQLLIQNGEKISIWEHEKETETEAPIKEIHSEFKIEKCGSLHTSIISEDYKQMLLMDQSSFYQLDLFYDFGKVMKKYEDQQVANTLLLSNYIYCLAKENEQSIACLCMYDISTIFNSQFCFRFFLAPCTPIVDGQIEYNVTQKSILYQKDYGNFVVSPNLHSTTQYFKGMNKRIIRGGKTMKAFTRFENKFACITRENEYQMWNLATSKMICNIQCKDDFSQFQLYRHTEDDLHQDLGWCKYQLMWNPEPLKGVTAKDVLPSHFIDSPFENCHPWSLQYKQTFHEFKIVDLTSGTHPKVLSTFVHAKTAFGTYSRIQAFMISKDGQFMLEQQHDLRNVLWAREACEHTDPSYCKWRPIRVTDNFPGELLGDFKFHKKIVSPNLEHILRPDYANNGFLIENLKTGALTGRIPTYIMNHKMDAKLEYIANRFIFSDDEHFVFISRDGVARRYRIEDFAQTNYIKLPFFKDTHMDFPIFIAANDHDPDDNEFILARKVQKLKMARYLYGKNNKDDIYTALISPNYQQSNVRDRIMIENSWTYFHWVLIEQIACNQLTVDDLTDDQLGLACMQILPGCQTVLHKLARKKNAFRAVIERISNLEMEVPFTRNFKGQSPLDILLEQKDVKSIEMLMKYLSTQDMDHHAREIAPVLAELIEMGSTTIENYIGSRVKESFMTKMITKGGLKGNEGRVVTAQNIICGKQVLKEALFNPEKLAEEVKVTTIDIPFIHEFGDKSDNFFDALAQSDSVDLFYKEPIQNAIDFMYPHVARYTILKLFLPFLAFTLLFSIYINFVYDAVKNESMGVQWGVNVPFQVVIAGLATYFVLNEFKQLIEDGLAYFSSIWNLIDIIPPINIYIFIVLDWMNRMGAFGDEEPIGVIRTFLAVAIFFMWIKFLYFCRVFKSTGYLIRMIIEVMIDMKTFFFVLLIGFVAFGDSYGVLSDGQIKESDHYTNGMFDAFMYAYRMALGDFSYGEFGTFGTAWAKVLFIMCTIFNMIVMLNLLIAIISETFAKVNENQVAAGYAERAALIAENGYLVPDSIRNKLVDKQTLLFCATLNTTLPDDAEEPAAEKEKTVDVNKSMVVMEDRLSESKAPAAMERAMSQVLAKLETQDFKREVEGAPAFDSSDLLKSITGTINDKLQEQLQKIEGHNKQQIDVIRAQDKKISVLTEEIQKLKEESGKAPEAAPGMDEGLLTEVMDKHLNDVKGHLKDMKKKLKKEIKKVADKVETSDPKEEAKGEDSG